MLPGQGHEPERKLGKLDRVGVSVYPKEAALRYEPPGVELGVFIWRDGRRRAGPLPRLDQPRAEVATYTNKKGARSHGGIADSEVEELLRRRGSSERL